MSDTTKTRRVSRLGIALSGIWYVHPALTPLVGEQVEVRQRIDCAAAVEVYWKDRLFCTATVDPWRPHDGPPSVAEVER